MGAHTVIKHALIQGLESVSCAQHAGFGESRPATHTARYLPTSQDGAAGNTEALCAPCASNQRVYCDVRPLPVVTPSRGVSLVKPGDTPVAPVAVEAVTGEVRLTGADGSWVTYESRVVVEGWCREALRKGGYVMAAAWGKVLRGE